MSQLHKSPDANSLYRILSSQSNSHRITLTDSFIGDQGIKTLISFLSDHPNISILELKGNNISPSGFSSLCDALRLHYKLSSLICEWNNIGLDESGIQSLAILTDYNKNLIHVDLRNNKLGINEAKIIGKILKNNTSLLSLDIRWNEIRNKGISYILDGLKENFTLLYLEIQGNNISGENQKAVEYYLDRNRSQNKISKEDILGNRKEKLQGSLLQKNVLKETEFNQYIENLDNPNIKEQTVYLNKLDEMLQVERKVNREINERLDDEMERLREKDLQDQRFIKEYEVKIQKTIIDNECLKRSNALLRKDINNLQDGTTKSLKFDENRLKSQEDEVETLEKSHRVFMSKKIEEHKRNMKDIDVEWDDRCKLLETRIKDIQSMILILQNEEKEGIQSLREKTSKFEEELQFLKKRKREEEECLNSFRLIGIEQKIELSRINLMAIIKRNGNLSNELRNLEERLPTELHYLEDESNSLKREHDVFFQKKQDFALLSNKIKTEMKIKEGKKEKLEKELEELREKQEKKQKHAEKDKNEELEKKQKEKEHWQKQKDKLLEKVADLETEFSEMSNTNLKLKNERQRLLQLIQSSVSKTVYEVFTVNRFI